MCIWEIKPSVYLIATEDWDRRLFDELIPLPDGTSYNAYLIKGRQKVALVDTADLSKRHEFMKSLDELKLNKVDYVISNHAEQDHSGAIPLVLETYPEAKVVTNSRCAELLEALLQIPKEKFILIDDGIELPLGGKTLEFILAPWVHWPETMFTYLKEDRILFTCDYLGSHLATSDPFAVDEFKVYEAAKRYYAEIMMPFRPFVRKHLEKISNLEVDVIAPSHGSIYRSPELILSAYREWSSDDVKNEVVLPFVSMHGSTREMVDYFIKALIQRGVHVKPFNLPKTDLGALAISLVDAATMVIATPTVLAGPHPAAIYAAHLVSALRPKLRYASIINSYGWGGRTIEDLTKIISNLKVEILRPVAVRGFPSEEAFKDLNRLADDVLSKHRSLGIAK